MGVEDRRILAAAMSCTRRTFKAEMCMRGSPLDKPTSDDCELYK
jgi:hypothetical protein